MVSSQLPMMRPSLCPGWRVVMSSGATPRVSPWLTTLPGPPKWMKINLKDNFHASTSSVDLSLKTAGVTAPAADHYFLCHLLLWFCICMSMPHCGPVFMWLWDLPFSASFVFYPHQPWQPCPMQSCSVSWIKSYFEAKIICSIIYSVPAWLPLILHVSCLTPVM